MGITAFRTAVLLLLILVGLSACSVLRLPRYWALRRFVDGKDARFFYSPRGRGYIALKDSCLCQDRYLRQLRVQYDAQAVNLKKVIRAKVRGQGSYRRKSRMQFARRHSSLYYGTTRLYRLPGSCNGLYSWWDFDFRYPANAPRYRGPATMDEQLLVIYHDTLTLVGKDTVANQRLLRRLLRSELQEGALRHRRDLSEGRRVVRID